MMVAVTTLKAYTAADILTKVWRESPKSPVIHPPFPDFLQADPIVLAPQESPDHKWHLFAHGVAGLYHHVSKDGYTWKLASLVGWLMERPWIYQENGIYYLFYEQVYNAHHFPYYDSTLECRSSHNLYHWSKPTTILTPTLPWHRTKNTVGNVCSPSVIKVGSEYRLYYSAGLTYLPECRFCEPKSIGYATASHILGPYTLTPNPITKKVYQKTVYPHPKNPNKPYSWTPSVRVHALKRGYLGISPFYWYDAKLKKSRADVRISYSPNGHDWNQEYFSKPIISPNKPWKKSHAYVGSIALAGKTLRMYYNARNGWLWGREAIGLNTIKL